ncbi:hypothetical protein CEXT_86571 [Caerostris extrusa]|uniref:Uncharacterized protein n=1 Tax=Caerostris extrusa TaxID=172846 RepID=A0AAV4N6J3_CAEEX|nr:hypothetical protein CEXT_86571 [Caerostris extrusa]
MEYLNEEYEECSFIKLVVAKYEALPSNVFHDIFQLQITSVRMYFSVCAGLSKRASRERRLSAQAVEDRNGYKCNKAECMYQPQKWRT